MPNLKQKETALIIDANSLIHRAWHALPPLTTPDGKLVNAVYGFTSVLLKILASERPTYLAVCWDTKEPTYRHKAKPEYKAHREEQPDDFYEQFPIAKEVVKVFGGTNVELPGYEADDLLATFGIGFINKNVQVTLLTSDKDMLQVIRPGVDVIAFKKGVSETTKYDEETLKEVTGLTPDQQAYYKALRGDSSDNLKGVPGIGEKTATDLLIKYKDLEGVFKAAHDEKSDLSPSQRRKLVEGEQEARDTLPIVRLDENAPVKEKLSDLKRRKVDEEEMRKLFTALGFKTLLVRAMGSDKNKTQEQPKTQKKARLSTEHLISPTAKDIKSFFEIVGSEGKLVVSLPQKEQQSLFNLEPAIALGSDMISLLISSELLKEKDVATLLGLALANPEINKSGHGLKSVWHWARAHKFDLNGIDFDTEMASYILSGGEGGHDLALLAAAHIDTTLPDTDERPLFEIDAIRRLRDLFTAQLKEQKLDTVIERFETPLISILAKMEGRGILINRDYFKKLTGEFQKENDRLEREMEELAGESFNPASPQQLAHILFEVLELPTKGIKKGKTGYSTAAPELAKLEGKHPIISKVSDYREIAKLLSTYVESIPALADKNDRVHTTFNQALTATGRLSSANPNLQNIPVRTELGRKIRRGFIAPKGYSLLACDYSQIELRIVAALAKDEKMLEAFEKGQDIHSTTAAAIWGVPLEEVTKEQRRTAKAINFGIIYGQGSFGLSRVAGISFEEAKQFIEEYFLVYSGVREFLDQTKALARSRGYVETLFGRRRVIAEIQSMRPELRAAAERMAINMPVQGTAADLIKLAMIEVDKRLPEISADTRMLLQVHDELVLEVPDKEVEKVAKEVAEIMQGVEKIGVPIVVDSKAGKNWDEMKKI
ncbi:MAG: DNA polymerase I [Patescibacteria group bacterium]